MSVCKMDDNPWCSPGTCPECDAARRSENKTAGRDMTEKEEKVAHLRMCIDDGFIRLDKVRQEFNTLADEARVASQRATEASARRDVAFEKVEKERRDLSAWLKELERAL